jgi:hypothetical protein
MVWDKQKQREYQREWYRRHPGYGTKSRQKWSKAHPDRAKNTYLRYHYGITFEQYSTQLNLQNGCCAICHGQQKQKSRWGGKLRYMCVDHDKNTGAVRGLLCEACNTALGFLKDDPMVIYAAFRYLVKSRLRQTA